MAIEEGVHDDLGESNTQCTDHPFKNSSPGGICAFCLQEKLGKLVSSSFPTAIFPNSSSSSSPSFRSESAIPVRPTSISSSINNNDCQNREYCSRRARISFLLTQKTKNKKLKEAKMADQGQNGVVLKRSKSTATPRRRGHFLDEGDRYSDIYSPRKRGFWSFLYLSKHSSNGRKIDKSFRDLSYGGSSSNRSTAERKKEEFEAVDEDDESPGTFDRKVSRSRSVGCGSRSFSGDFFERISTGFGDCTLRRVESQREGKSKVSTAAGAQDCIKERVKCGGIFSGFMLTSSSSSYWVSSSTEHTAAIRPPETAARVVDGRSKSWGWAFASPIRAFSKPSSVKREGSTKNTTTTIPSLLAVGSLRPRLAPTSASTIQS